MTLKQVLSKENMKAAYTRVVENKGAAGIDGMGVDELKPYLQINWQQLTEKLEEGKYKPSPVRRVTIPKPNGGERSLGIPTVLDRMLQQGISQQLTKHYDTTFSEYSYGFRKGRSCHQALDTALWYLNEGYVYVVEIDLEKFFDKVNHDRLMHRLSIDIKDKELLRLIRRYLQSGVMEGGLISRTEEGTPQGGNLSPLLSNIVLDELDKELECRGHRFVRYADDISIFVKSRKAGERVLQSISNWIEKKLKLTVNQEKSGVKHYTKGGLLGFGFYKDGEGVKSRILGKSYLRFQRKLKRLTKRSWSMSMEDRLTRINQVTIGWLYYFGKAKGKSRIKRLDEWLCRRLRMCIWKQWKLIRTRHRSLMKLGVADNQAYQWANTRKGYWRIAGSPILQSTVTYDRLIQNGYKPLSTMYKDVHLLLNLMNRRDTRTVRPVV